MKKTFVTFIMMLCASAFAFSQTIVSSDETIDIPIPNVRVAVHGGGAYRLAKVASTNNEVLDQHLKNLKWGFTYGADATYFFTETLGAGIKYNNMHSFSSEDVTITYDDGTRKSGKLEDNIDIWFIGPMVSYRKYNLSNGNTFFMNLGYGYMGYHDDYTVISSYELKGGTLGEFFDIGYDVRVSGPISVGAQLSWYSGTLTSYTQTPRSGQPEKVELDKDNYEGLGHLTLSAGVRINF